MIQRLFVVFVGILGVIACGESRFDLSKMGKELHGISYSISPDAKNDLQVHLSGERPDILNVTFDKTPHEDGTVSIVRNDTKVALSVSTSSKGEVKELRTTEHPILGFFRASPDALAVLGIRAFEEANQMNPLAAYKTELISKRTETNKDSGRNTIRRNTIHSYVVETQVILATGVSLPKHALIAELRRPNIPVQLHIVTKQTPVIQTDKDGVLRIILEYAAPKPETIEVEANKENPEITPATSGTTTAHPIRDEIEL